jgi:hypothetical protein
MPRRVSMSILAGAAMVALIGGGLAGFVLGAQYQKLRHGISDMHDTVWLLKAADNGSLSTAYWILEGRLDEDLLLRAQSDKWHLFRDPQFAAAARLKDAANWRARHPSELDTIELMYTEQDQADLDAVVRRYADR